MHNRWKPIEPCEIAEILRRFADHIMAGDVVVDRLNQHFSAHKTVWTTGRLEMEFNVVNEVILP